MTPPSVCPRCAGWMLLREGLCPACLLQTLRSEGVDLVLAPGATASLKHLGDPQWDSSQLPDSVENDEGNQSGTISIGRTKPATDAELLPAVPGHDVLEMLGRGGMGVVYKARSRKLGRIVALKMVRSGLGSQGIERERFFAEARVVARLQHPNIVQIYEFDEHEGVPYFTQEFCNAGSLAELLRKREDAPLEPRAAALLLETLARAIEAAHQHQIIHRDLTPANILFTDPSSTKGTGAVSTETLDEGKNPKDVPAPTVTQVAPERLTPKISDFGLAKTLDDTQTHTVSGAIVGTPSYMSPEQASGTAKCVGPAADVYALGAILYKVISGHAPFRAPTAMETILQVLQDEPVPPRQLQSHIPRDLETICLKCLQKDPAKRYAGALALAEDLARWRNGEPIRARPVGIVERVWRWCQRNRAAASLAALAVLLLVTGIVVSSVLAVWALGEKNEAEANAALYREQRTRAEVARQRADAEKADAQKARAQAERNLAAATYLQVQSMVAEDPDSALELLNNPEMIRPDARCVCWSFFHDYCQRRLRTLDCLTASLTWSPDGETLAAVNPDGRIQFWQRKSGREIFLLKGTQPAVAKIAWSPDGSRIAATGETGAILLWDARSGQSLPPLKKHRGRVELIAWSADGNTLASLGSDAVIIRWDVAAGRESDSGPGPSGQNVLAFSNDLRFLATASYDDVGLGKRAWRMHIWHVGDDKAPLTVHWGEGAIHALTWSADDRSLAAMNHQGTTALWDTATWKVRALMRGKGYSPVIAGAWSPDGETIATSSWNLRIQLWDPQTREVQCSFKGHDDEVRVLAWSRDGSALASASIDGKIKIWETKVRQERAILEAHTSFVQSVRFSSDGRLLASGAADRSVILWDTTTLKKTGIATEHSAPVTALAWGPEDRTIASVGDDTVCLWDIKKTHASVRLRGHVRFAEAVAYRRDGKILAAGYRDGTVLLWRCDGKLETTCKGHADRVMSVECNTDGSTFASAGMDGAVKLWNTSTGKQILTIQAHEGGVHEVAWSADGKRLATAGQDQTAKIWDADTGRMLARCRGHTHFVRSVAWSRDGKTLASGGWDQTIRLWDAESGQERARLVGHSDVVSSLDFSPDGTMLASGGDHTVRLWHVGVRK